MSLNRVSSQASLPISSFPVSLEIAYYSGMRDSSSGIYISQCSIVRLPDPMLHNGILHPLGVTRSNRICQPKDLRCGIQQLYPKLFNSTSEGAIVEDFHCHRAQASVVLYLCPCLAL
jgi:hypothetical protein